MIPRDSTISPLRLPFGDGAFEVVLGHRLLRSGVDAVPMIREALRVLEPNGRFVLFTDFADLRSAPLPAGGAVHLVQRTLRAAGVDRMRFIERPAGSIAIVAASTPR